MNIIRIHLPYMGNNNFKRKLYTFPDGEIVKIQGHEHHTLNYLLSSSISQNDIKLKSPERPTISYEWNGSTHKYFPDCYISSSNTIVETKSPWTWEFQKDRNLAKVSGSLNGGYNVRVIVWETTKCNIKLINDTTFKA